MERETRCTTCISQSFHEALKVAGFPSRTLETEISRSGGEAGKVGKPSRGCSAKHRYTQAEMRVTETH